MSIDGIKGMFLLLQNVFRINQCIYKLVEELDNLLANIS